MSEFVIAYFIFGLGFYVGMCIRAPLSDFTGASFASLLRGLILTFVIWPVGLIAAIFIKLQDEFL